MKLGHVLVWCGLALLVASSAIGEPARQTIVKRKGKEPKLVDSATYRASRDAFRIREDKASFEIPAAEVDYVKPPKPDGFDTCTDEEVLESLIVKHRRAWWDVEALKKLLPLLLEKGKYVKAVEQYEAVREGQEEAIPVSARRLYWDALRQCDRDTRLKADLSDAITNGTREESSWAFLARGDLLLSYDRRREALQEGYLRTVVLFEDIQSSRKTALEKTIKVMLELSDPRAGKFRQMLREAQ